MTRKIPPKNFERDASRSRSRRSYRWNDDIYESSREPQKNHTRDAEYDEPLPADADEFDYYGSSRMDRGYNDRGFQIDTRANWDPLPSHRHFRDERTGPMRWESESMQDHSETYADYAGGPHVGKGPKGYKRSPDRLREEVCETLAQHPAIDASEIEVLVEDGNVILDGSVPDRRMKYFAESAIEAVWGVDDIVNRLKVSRYPHPPVSSGAV